MNYVDTHCHLDSILDKMKLLSYEALKRDHFPENFEKCVTIACASESFDSVLGFFEYGEIYGAFGIHPHEARTFDDKLEERLRECMRHPKCVAWGEIGLDYFYNHSEPALQREVFIRQITAGLDCGKPLVVHTREAEADTLAIMRKHIPSDWKVHVHCFTSSPKLATDLLSHFPNLYIGFTGIVTFKNAEDVRETVKIVPLEKILLETDAPYLAPAPYRGQVAHPGHVPHIARKIAELKKVSLEEVYLRARENTKQMYGI